MKVKAVDIAKKLNISKASVSLALNGKPGVSQETKEAVLRCKKELEQHLTEQEERKYQKEESVLEEESFRNEEKARAESLKEPGLTLKIIMFSKKMSIVRDSEMDLLTGVLEVFDREAKRNGYVIGITYVGNNQEEIDLVVEECNGPNVAGAILYATEMEEADFESFQKIKKPMVVFDNDFENEYHSVVIDNVTAVRKAVDYLVEHGCRRIQYLAQDTDIYNFRQRRAGFRAGLRKNGLELKEDSFVRMGTAIHSVEERMVEYLKEHELPDAYIMENYQISIGVLGAMRILNISVPEEISLVGVDEIPSYAAGNCALTTVKVSHAERAAAVMMFLLREIQEEIPEKFKIMSRCTLVTGNSVKEK